MKKTLSQQLSDYFCSCQFEQLPIDVLQKTKNALIDFVGVAIGGISTPQGQNFLKIAKSFGYSKQGSTVLGTFGKVPLLEAAFLNGSIGHCLQYDDGSSLGMGHPGAVIIPSALAVAEETQASGKDVLLAIALGYEGFARIGYALNPFHFQQGFNPTGTVGNIGSAITASKLYGHSSDTMVQAIGLSGSVSGGLLEFAVTGTESTYFTTGHSSRTGVLAAISAESGITGPSSILEGKKGIFKTMSHQFVETRVIEGLGSVFRMLKTYEKLYPTCRHTHPTIEAIIQMKAESNFDFSKIKKIEINTYSVAADECDYPNPNTVTGLENSLQVCSSIAAVFGKMTIEERNLDILNDEWVRKIASCVIVKPSKELDTLLPNKRAARVRILFTDDSELEKFVDTLKGDPETPLDDNERLNKFLSCSSPVITESKAKELYKKLMEFETMNNISDLFNDL